MFPFTYHKRINISTEGYTKIDLDILIDKFKGQFDNPKHIKPDIITFKNFNVFFKRHNWLDNGVIMISVKDHEISVDLHLNFYILPILFLIVQLALIIINIHQIWFALLGVTMFWIFFGILFFWTTTMFNMTIKRIIKHQLFLTTYNLND